MGNCASSPQVEDLRTAAPSKLVNEVQAATNEQGSSRACKAGADLAAALIEGPGQAGCQGGAIHDQPCILAQRPAGGAAEDDEPCATEHRDSVGNLDGARFSPFMLNGFDTEQAFDKAYSTDFSTRTTPSDCPPTPQYLPPGTKVELPTRPPPRPKAEKSVLTALDRAVSATAAAAAAAAAAAEAAAAEAADQIRVDVLAEGAVLPLERQSVDADERSSAPAHTPKGNRGQSSSTSSTAQLKSIQEGGTSSSSEERSSQAVQAALVDLASTHMALSVAAQMGERVPHNMSSLISETLNQVNADILKDEDFNQRCSASIRSFSQHLSRSTSIASTMAVRQGSFLKSPDQTSTELSKLDRRNTFSPTSADRYSAPAFSTARSSVPNAVQTSSKATGMRPPVAFLPTDLAAILSPPPPVKSPGAKLKTMLQQLVPGSKLTSTTPQSSSRPGTSLNALLAPPKSVYGRAITGDGHPEDCDAQSLSLPLSHKVVGTSTVGKVSEDWWAKLLRSDGSNGVYTATDVSVTKATVQKPGSASMGTTGSVAGSGEPAEASARDTTDVLQTKKSHASVSKPLSFMSTNEQQEGGHTSKNVALQPGQFMLTVPQGRNLVQGPASGAQPGSQIGSQTVGGSRPASRHTRLPASSSVPERNSAPAGTQRKPDAGAGTGARRPAPEPYPSWMFASASRTANGDVHELVALSYFSPKSSSGKPPNNNNNNY